MAQFDVSAAFAREADRIGAIASGSEKAKQRAVGTLARRLPVEARRDIQAEYNLTATRIREGIRVTRGSGFVEVTGSKRGIGMINFGARWPGRKSEGVTVAILKSEGRSLYAGLFIARGIGGNQQVFERTGDKRPAKAGRYVGQRRQALKTYYGPSVAQMMRKAGLRDRLADFAQEILRTEFDRLLGAAR